jgi:hypothetical protein
LRSSTPGSTTEARGREVIGNKAKTIAPTSIRLRL